MLPVTFMVDIRPAARLVRNDSKPMGLVHPSGACVGFGHVERDLMVMALFQVGFQDGKHPSTQSSAAERRLNAEGIQVSPVKAVCQFMAVANQLDEYLPDDAKTWQVSHP